MRLATLLVFFSLSAYLSSAGQAPIANVTTDTQALSILQRSLAALSPNIAVQDLTLSGSAHYIAGSDDETGTATLKATALGDSRVDLTLSSGVITEIDNLSVASPIGAWFSDDRTPHKIALHNLLAETAWFAPAAVISRRLLGASFVAQYIGVENIDGQSVQHVLVFQQPLKGADPKRFQHLTQIDVDIDSSTLLPAVLSFNVHTDDDALVDIPVEVHFSDYRLVNGARFPFHIQKFFNKSLLLDLQLDSAEINTGVPAVTFSVS